MTNPISGQGDSFAWARSGRLASIDLMLEKLQASGGDNASETLLNDWRLLLERAKNDDELDWFLDHFKTWEILVNATDLPAAIKDNPITPAPDAGDALSNLACWLADKDYVSSPDFQEKPSANRVASVRESIVELDLTIKKVLPVTRWTAIEVRNRAVDFLGSIALEFLTVGDSCNANLLRVEDRILKCRALVETNVRGQIA